MECTYVFDVWARVNGDDVAMLDSEVVANDSVHSGAAIVEVVISQDNQNSVLSLLALDEHCIASEELEGLHGVVGEGNDRIVIIRGICDTAVIVSSARRGEMDDTYINELGFFFFLRIAVEVSSSSLFSVPEASLLRLSV